MDNPMYQVGEEVRLKGQRNLIGTIQRAPEMRGGVYWYTVYFSQNNKQKVPESSLELHVGARDPATLFKEGCFGNKEAFAANLTYIKLKQPLRDYLYSFLASRTEFYPYQFKPLVKFLNSPNRRLLVADEVGLGKTIEAGLIISELRVREPLDRVLVVCPSALKLKWREEMRRRFDEEFVLLNSSNFREFIERFNEKGGFERIRAICSLQMLRASGLQQLISESALALDLVIIDEAHHMRNPGTLSHNLGRVLGDAADAMLLLTATPIQLGNENLFNLLRLLDPEEFDSFDLFKQRLSVNGNVVKTQRVLEAKLPANLMLGKQTIQEVEKTAEKKRFLDNPIYHELLRKFKESNPSDRNHIIDMQQDVASLNLLAHIFTRSRKRDVIPERPVRVPHVIPVDFSEAERRFYQDVTNYVRAQAGTSGFAAFIAMMPQRQMASCIPAMLEKYSHIAPDAINELTEEESDIDTEEEMGSAEGASHYAPMRDARLLALVNQGKNKIAKDSKYEAFRAAIKELDAAEPGRKIIVFSYFKKTHSYLAKRLAEDGYSSLVINGDVPSRPNDPVRDERAQRIAKFKDPKSGIRILISSEVGSEGIDLQFCHIIFNYDLPWNPMKVEQRIGRLDRLGQLSKRILIFNFAVRDTIEERILNRLYVRIKIFEESIGDLEAILGEEIQALERDLLTATLTPQEEESRIEQTANALIRRKIEQEVLEKQSSQFVGHDAFFDEEITRIREQKRYLTPEEVQVFISDFLNQHYPKASLRPIEEPEGCYELYATDDLIQFVRSKVSENDPLLGPFLQRLFHNRAKVTFRADLAFQNPDSLEYLYLQSPLVQAVVKYYQEHEDALNRVSSVELKTQLINQGDYVYFIYLVQTHALKKGFKLESIILNAASGEVCAEDVGIQITPLMVEVGQTYSEEPPIGPQKRRELYQVAEDLIAARINKTQEELARLNAAMVTQKRENISQSYDRKINRRKEELKEGQRKGWQDRRLRMSEGAIRNLKADREKKLKQLEEASNISVSADLFAAGYLKVIQ